MYSFLFCKRRKAHFSFSIYIQISLLNFYFSPTNTTNKQKTHQQVDKQHVKNLTLPNSGSKHSHRSKTHSQNNLSHNNRHDTSGSHGRSSGLSPSSSSSSASSTSHERSKGKYSIILYMMLMLNLKVFAYFTSMQSVARSKNKKVVPTLKSFCFFKTFWSSHYVPRTQSR